MDDRALIAETNRSFYRALAGRDMRMMDQVWLHADWVGCVHPGWALLVGWQTIRQSWVDIFASGQHLQIMPSQVVIHIEKDLAWVTCVENITAHDDPVSRLLPVPHAKGVHTSRCECPAPQASPADARSAWRRMMAQGLRGAARA